MVFSAVAYRLKPISFAVLLLLLLVVACSKKTPNDLDALAVTTLRVIQDSVPNNVQDFVFTTTGGNGLPAGFSLDDDGNATLPKQLSFSVVAGNYSVAQTAVSGWRLTSATCMGDNVTPTNTADDRILSPSAIDILDGETVVCTFVNKKTGSIRVIKDAVPDSAQNFTFTRTGTGSPASFSLDDDADATLLNQRTWGLLVPGNYSVTETAVSGWTQTSATCTGNNGTPSNVNDDRNLLPNAINLLPNELVICTFVNSSQPPKLKVTKLLAPTSDFGTFNLTIDGIIHKAAASHNGTTGFIDVSIGTHTVGETIAAGTLSNYIATIGGDCASDGTITLAAGETKECTITNTRIAKLIIVKNTVGGNGTFAFATTSPTTTPLPGTFNMTTGSNVATRTFSSLLAGTYSVTEAPLAGWTLTGTSCSDGSPVNAISLSPGETVTCTFNNTKLATITITKTANNGNGTFQFTSTNPAIGNFALTTVAGTASRTVNNLPLGIYNVAETVPANWNLDSATCSDGSPVTAIDLAAGEVVNCTFTNTQQLGNLTIQKVTVGADGLFRFTSTSLGNFSITTSSGLATKAFNNIPVGIYNVAETVPTGWRLDSASCSDGSPVSAINLSENENITCTFTNTKLGKLIVVKNTLGGNGGFSFTSSTLAGFTLNTVGGTASRTISNLVPGTYDVTETSATGWRFDGVTCSDGSPASAIVISANETVTCTFINAKLPSLTIQKTTQGGDRSFTFTSTTTPTSTSLPLTSFTVSTSGGTGSRIFSNLAEGTYNVSETVPSGWQLTGATCSDGSPITAVNLSVGENVVCTFNNFKLGKITITKNAIGGEGLFRFTSLTLGNFQVTTTTTTTNLSTATRSFSNLTAGVYDVAELSQPGWDLTNVSCSDGSPASAINLADHEEVT